jgi:hypothetical protein
MSFIICSHNNGESARALADMLGCRLASHKLTNPLPSKHKIINLGCSTDSPLTSRMTGQVILNSTAAVTRASSKIRTLERLNSVESSVIPPFRTDVREVALLVAQGESWVARTLDRASSGRGIELMTPASIQNGIPRASVYVKAIDKRREYRVHVGRFAGQSRILDVTRKIRRPGVDDTNRPFVWNHDNDFIFVRNGVNRDTIPRSLLMNAIRAVQALGLNFGAVDIVVPRGGRIVEAASYVLEVNTAQGMEGTTLEAYAQFFRAVDNDLRDYPETVWSGDFTEETNTED